MILNTNYLRLNDIPPGFINSPFDTWIRRKYSESLVKVQRFGNPHNTRLTLINSNIPGRR